MLNKLDNPFERCEFKFSGMQDGQFVAYASVFNGVDAYKALALANQWHWEKQPVKTHITTNEVVFQFDSGTTKTIALPSEKVMIAVAPYINKTHT